MNRVNTPHEENMGHWKGAGLKWEEGSGGTLD